MRGVSKDRVRLTPGSIPAHADTCGDYINIGMASKALQVRHSYATSADCTPCRSEHVTDRGRLSRDPVMLLPVVAFACAMRSRAAGCTGEAGPAQKSRSRVRGFGGVFTFFCKWCTFVNRV